MVESVSSEVVSLNTKWSVDNVARKATLTYNKQILLNRLPIMIYLKVIMMIIVSTLSLSVFLHQRTRKMELLASDIKRNQKPGAVP